MLRLSGPVLLFCASIGCATGGAPPTLQGDGSADGSVDAGADGDADFSDQAMKGRQYTWSGGETLVQLRDRRDEILEKHDRALESTAAKKTNLTLMDALSETLNDEDDSFGCNVCHL